MFLSPADTHVGVHCVVFCFICREKLVFVGELCFAWGVFHACWDTNPFFLYLTRVAMSRQASWQLLKSWKSQR